MMNKIIALLGIVLASTAVAGVMAIPKPSQSFNQAPLCWPDESAQACWQHAEHRPN